MKSIRNKLIMALFMSLVLIISGCAGSLNVNPAITNTPGTTSSKPNAQIELKVSAAASLSKVLTEINNLYIQVNPEIKITPNFASSGTLQMQIENGAPADIFFSAAEDKMDILQDKSLILNDTRKSLLNNQIVLIVPVGSTLNITGFNDLIEDKVKKIGIGDPKSVPAGAYALQAFEELGIADKLESKEVLGASVSQVLTYVESGDVDAGMVYSTDALISAKVRVVATGPADVNSRIAYPIAVIKASGKQDAGKAYIDFLQSSADAKAIFEKYGFTMALK